MSLDDDVLLAIIAVCLKKKEIEDKKKRTKRLWVKEQSNENRNEYTYQHLLEELKTTPTNDFRHFFARDASIYEELLNMIGPLIKKKDTLMRVAIPVGSRLSTTLRFLATGYHFENMRGSGTISSSSISKIVLETCEAIITKLKEYIKPPETKEQWKAVANDFKKKWNFPNCLGAVNGKHIAIIKPSGSKSLYYNYRKFFSVVLMAVVNANYEFLAVDVDITGGISGLENFCNTPLGNVVCGKGKNLPNPVAYSGSEELLPYVFVGNDGFQLTEKFLKNYTGNCLSKKDKETYNYHVNRVHQIVENTFGTLSWQFGVLQKPINLAPEKVKPIVLACCYLYNYFKRKSAVHLWNGVFDKDNLGDGSFTEGSWREISELTSLQTPVQENVSWAAEQAREQFMIFFNNERQLS